MVMMVAMSSYGRVEIFNNGTGLEKIRSAWWSTVTSGYPQVQSLYIKEMGGHRLSAGTATFFPCNSTRPRGAVLTWSCRSSSARLRLLTPVADAATQGTRAIKSSSRGGNGMPNSPGRRATGVSVEAMVRRLISCDDGAASCADLAAGEHS